MPHHGLRAAAIVAMFVATYALTHAMPSRSPSAGLLPVADVPVVLSDWSGVPAPPLDAETMRTLGADRYVHRYYAGPDGVIEMDIAYYAHPQIGSSMHSPLNCLPGNGWAVSDVKVLPVRAGNRTWEVKHMTAQRGTARFAMAYWFQGRDRIVSDEVSTRFYLLADAIRRRPTDTSLVRLMMRSEGRDAAEHGTLSAFAARVIAALADVSGSVSE